MDPEKFRQLEAMEKAYRVARGTSYSKVFCFAMLELAYQYAENGNLAKAHEIVLGLDPTYFDSDAIKHMKELPEYYDHVNKLYTRLHDAGLVNYLLGYVGKEASA